MANRRSLALRRNDVSAPLRPYAEEVVEPEAVVTPRAATTAWTDNFERVNGPPGPGYITPTAELVGDFEPVPFVIVNGALECPAGVTGPVGFGQGPFGTMRFGEY